MRRLENENKIRYDHHCRTPQRGQVHPDQLSGGRENRHRIQQAPDHPQPHLRHRDEGRHSVRVRGYPWLPPGKDKAGRLHGKCCPGIHFRRGSDHPCGGADRVHRPPGGRADGQNQEQPLPRHSCHQQNRHRGKGRPSGGHCRLFSGGDL